MIDGIVLAVTVVLEVGSSAVGTAGMLGEHTVKLLDKEEFEGLRKLGELFSKTLQNGAAAFSLIILGSLFVHSAFIPLALVIGVTMVITPYVKEGIQYSDNPKLKKTFDVLEKAVDITAKTVNTAVITTGIYLALGIPAAVLAGVGIGALNVMAHNKA